MNLNNIKKKKNKTCQCVRNFSENLPTRNVTHSIINEMTHQSPSIRKKHQPIRNSRRQWMQFTLEILIDWCDLIPLRCCYASYFSKELRKFKWRGIVRSTFKLKSKKENELNKKTKT